MRERWERFLDWLIPFRSTTRELAQLNEEMADIVIKLAESKGRMDVADEIRERRKGLSE